MTKLNFLLTKINGPHHQYLTLLSTLFLPNNSLPLPLALEVSFHTYKGRRDPCGSYRDPDAPVAQEGNSGEELRVQNTADHLRNSVDHGKSGICASVQQCAGHIDHAQCEIKQTDNAQRSVTDINNLLLLHKDTHDLMSEFITIGLPSMRRTRSFSQNPHSAYF